MLERLALAQGAGLPASIAMTWLGGEVTFGKLSEDVNRTAAALLQLRDLSPKVIGVHFTNPYRHWLVVLALSKLGIASASLPDQVDVTFQKTLEVLSPDIVLLEKQVDVPIPQPLVLEEAWFEHITASPEASIVRDIIFLPDDVVRVALVNGTNGTLRKIKLTARHIEISVYHLVFQDLSTYGYRNNELRVVPTLGPTTPTGFLIVISALASGARLQMLQQRELGLAFSQKAPTVAISSPIHITAILDQMPPGMEPLKSLYLTVAGGKLPNELRERIRDKLTPNIQVVYGAEECGIATVENGSTSSDDAVGKSLPWVNLQIVDDADVVVPPETIGQVRISGTGVVSGYADEPEATSRQFRNGWFYPGDKGSLTQDGILHLHGRCDDLVNFGGEKFDLHTLDAHALQCEGVTDAAMFTVPDELGLPSPWIALVSSHNFSLEAFSDWMRKSYPSLPEASAVFVMGIPRLNGGQPDRAALSQAVKQS
ncbi:acyl-CoA synthetase [Gluconobacter oxydans]|uniref:class I adenylate-forming enzyme family protein n=1 Tax=Gluconobacter thailandicus TaxID=257438 RepID=UPI0002998842|nr:class I adenylate-forming enzyme family protein [Gluconobacter thailandicus]AFW02634.1 hypothetical protein B932_3089 [Gluconobacter oxydans H24]ANQ41889.1 acyl-CoA synthetase [Gluconobacter oxydans]